MRQEFYGLLLTHFAVHGLMHEAALKAGEDPHRLAFVHAVRPEILTQCVVSSRGLRRPRGVRRRQSKFPVRRRQ